jgi:hypothetical protein
MMSKWLSLDCLLFVVFTLNSVGMYCALFRRVCVYQFSFAFPMIPLVAPYDSNMGIATHKLLDILIPIPISTGASCVDVI